MDNELFRRFRSLSNHSGLLGLEWSDNVDMTYFCTPIGAEIIGWPGVEGIHFCFIPSISSEMVFVVSPMPCGGHYVEPVARNFRDFLSLVLFCKGASPLEGISYMNEKQFLELIESENNLAWSDRDVTLEILHTKLGIEAQPDAFRYVRSLQAEFNYDIIPFSKEYYEILI